MLAAYRKTVASLVGTVLTWASLAYMPTGHVDRNGWFALALAVATSFGVFGVTNTPKPAPVVLEPEPSSVRFLDAAAPGVRDVVAPSVLAPVSPPVLAVVPAIDPTAALPGHITPA